LAGRAQRAGRGKWMMRYICRIISPLGFLPSFLGSELGRGTQG